MGFSPCGLWFLSADLADLPSPAFGRNQEFLSPSRQERQEGEDQVCVFPLAIFASLRKT
jgi:hypothetical protein